MRIDWWTLGLQTVNVLILIWILSKFLFRPVVAIIEERRAAAAKVLADAAAAKKQAVAAREAAEVEGAKIAAGRNNVLRQAAEDAAAQHAAVIASAREEADQLRAAAETEMRRTHAAEEAAASDRAAKLAVDIAGKLIARLPDAARVDGFVDGLAKALASLPATSRDGPSGAVTPRLTAARPLRSGNPVLPRRFRQGARPAARFYRRGRSRSYRRTRTRDAERRRPQQLSQRSCSHRRGVDPP
jgi:F-type H+-transporting ATPase subunit b